MVAITVILAAVIGAFVLEIGDQQETAPSTSFESDETIRYYGTNTDWQGDANVTRVGIAHAGGDVVDKRKMEVSVNGNASTYDVEQVGPGARVAGMPEGNFGNGEEIISCMPDEACELKSGQSMGVVLYGIAHENWLDNKGGTCSGGGINWDSHSNDYGPFPCGGPPGGVLYAEVLRTGDDINVVWEASSGGKTQTLFKYTVQSGSPDLPYPLD